MKVGCNVCAGLVVSYKFSISSNISVCFTEVCYCVTGKYDLALATFMQLGFRFWQKASSEKWMLLAVY